METLSLHCPNCSAPLDVAIGEVEEICSYCGSRLRFREEMKYKERVAVQKEVLRKKVEQEEMDRWRQTASKVAIAAMPVVGDVAGRALFGAAVSRGGGCIGCGCVGVLVVVGTVVALLLGAFS
jgi:hypothetical protein